MASHLRAPTLAFAGLSFCLNAAVIGCAGRTLNVFYTQQKSNDWLLPVWPQHFDLRGLQTLLGTSGAIMILNALLALAVLIQRLPAKQIIILLSALLSTVASLVAVILPTLLNAHAPHRDTIQTWTCRWRRTSLAKNMPPPDGFDMLCHETRFAFYTTIPVFILQLLLLSLAFFTLIAGPRWGNRSFHHKGIEGSSFAASGLEKSASQHELADVHPGEGGNVRAMSFETKSASPQSQHVAQMAGGKDAGFA